MNDFLVLLGMFIAGGLFMWLRPKIFKGAKKTLSQSDVIIDLLEKARIKSGLPPKQLNASIGNVYKKNGEEVFQAKKFFTGFGGLLSPVGWAKDIVGILGSRKLVIYIFIITILMGWSYWKGQQGKPINVNLGYEEAVEIEVPNSELRLFKPANSSKLYWIDKDGNKIAITVADIPALKKALKPISFQFRPIGIMGVGSGLDNSGFEGGAGFSFLRYWKWHLETFLTNKGIYLGTSYKLDLFGMKNSSLGVGIGKGYRSGEDRTIIYYRWRF